jgi:hypothetical protein
MRRIVTCAILLISILIALPQGWCSDPDEGLKTFGIRGGWMATSREEYFHQYEIFATYGLPWSIRADSGWGIAMQLNGAAGALRAAETTGFIGAIGPGIIFDKAGGKGIAIELGGDLNVLSRYKFGTVDLNGHVLWDGHMGVIYRFAAPGPGIGYRFQHMSNGGLNGNRNTGLDLHMITVNWNLP